MGTRKRIVSGFKASLLFLAAAVAVPGQSRAADISWAEYMHSAYIIASIAAAVSRVEHCSKPFTAEEIRETGDKRILVFTCNGSEDEEASSMLHLHRFGDGPWLPNRFDLAG